MPCAVLREGLSVTVVYFCGELQCGCYVPGLFAGKTVVGFDRRWNSGEERWIERLEDETGIGQVGEASAFLL